MNDSIRTIQPRGGRSALALGYVLSLTIFLAACATSGRPTTADDPAVAAGNSSPASGQTSAAASGGGDDAKAATIDVCALLTPTDAQTIGAATQLSSLPNVTYKLITEKPTKTASSSTCTLTVYNELSDGTPGNEAIVTVQVEPAKYRKVDDTKMAGGPGDAAYQDGDGGDFDQVVSGDYLFQSVQSQGASRELIDNMYRAMIPHLKSQLASS